MDVDLPNIWVTKNIENVFHLGTVLIQSETRRGGYGQPCHVGKDCSQGPSPSWHFKRSKTGVTNNINDG